MHSSATTFDGKDITFYGDYVDTLKAKMQYAHKVARKHMSMAAKRSKDLYNSRVAFHQSNRGDVVWCLIEVRKVGITSKLEYAYEGPFLILKKLSEIDLILQLDKKNNKIKPYEGVHPPKWIVRARKRLGNLRKSH